LENAKVFAGFGNREGIYEQMTRQNEEPIHDRLDSELLRAFAERGQEAAFEQIVLRHGGMVSAVCRSVLRNSADAEDATQAVFLTLVKRASSLQRHATLAGWLHRVAWYVATRAARAEANRRRYEEAAAHVWPDAPAAPADNVPAELVHAGLAGLSRKYQEPLLLHHVEGRSERETAELLNCTVSAISTRLARGRKMLRDRLLKRGLAVSAIGLSSALASAHAAESITPVLANSITSAAASVWAGNAVSAVASAQAAILSKGALKMIFMTQLKTAAIVTATCLATGALVSQMVLAAPGPNQGTTQPAAAPWIKLYADEAWYTDSNEKEQIFTGTLEGHKEPEVSILQRPHLYRLGKRLIYPGRKHVELDKLIGQKVEIRGKPYDINLEGQALSEVWPAAIRVVGPGSGTVLTPAGPLDPAIKAAPGTAVPAAPVAAEPAVTAPARRTTPIKIGGVANPRTPKVIVLFENDVDAPKELARLEKLYGFKSANVYTMPTFKGFAAVVSAAALEKLRWEPSVRMIEHDGGVGAN
jgi:RNA polymerase sigma factor (sigma-70 family)